MAAETLLSNPFRRVPNDEDRERTRREKQLALGRLWTERKITRERLQERGVSFTKADIEKYAEYRQSHQMGKTSEEAGWVEWMMLEGADGQGGVTGSEYEWFGDDVLTYNPNKIDDVLHRVDALLFFLDEEDERRAYPVAVDVISGEQGYEEKVKKDFERLHPYSTGMTQAYWIDTESDEAGDAIDMPGEGVIRALPVSVYVSGFFAEQYRNPKRTAAEADAVMRRLRPFVLEQMRREMEMQLLYLLGGARLDPRAPGGVVTEVRTRDELLQRLRRARPSSPRAAEAIEMLSHILPVIWRQCEKAGPMDEELARTLPDALRSFGVQPPEPAPER